MARYQPPNKRQKAERPSPLTVEEVRLSVIGALDEEVSGEPPFLTAALHAYSMLRRPTIAREVRDAALRVRSVYDSFQSGGAVDLESVKVFLLLACHRRYHAKAPASKDLAAAAKSGGEGGRDEDACGDGERLIFYVTILTLIQLARRGVPKAAESCHALTTLSRHVGGTRDAGFLAVHLLHDAMVSLPDSPLVMGDDRGNAGPSKKVALVTAIQRVCALRELERTDGCGPAAASQRYILLDLVRGIAERLDQDLELVRGKSKDDKGDGDPPALMSTQHAFMPHRGRGNLRGSSWRRNVVNCTAELLIWGHTRSASTEDRFRDAMTALSGMSLPPGDPEVDDALVGAAHEQILKMQTSTRKFLRALNEHARGRGFQLCSLYQMSPSAVTFRMVCHGKGGDLLMLQRRAKAAGDGRVLKMLANRGLRAKRAVYAESLHALIKQIEEVGLLDGASANDRAPSEKGGTEAGQADEIAILERQILRQTIQATLEHVRLSIKSTDRQRHKACICLDFDVPNQVCAALVAAALSPTCQLEEDELADTAAPETAATVTPSAGCRLSLPVVGDVDVSGFEALFTLLCGIVSDGRLQSERDDGTLESADEALRGIGPDHDVLLFASHSVLIGNPTLQRLGENNCTVRAHNVSLLLQKGEVKDVGSVEEIHLDLGSGTSSILCGACVMKKDTDDGEAEVVHYNNRRSSTGAVRHSGDTRDGNGHSCHTIDINLSQVPDDVASMWFTLCSCGSANLGGFREPRIRLINRATGEPLCEYRLQNSGDAMSVVMAVLTRCPENSGRWFVQAVGGSEAETRSRCCMNYRCMEPVFKSLRELGIGRPEIAASAAASVFDRQDVSNVSSSVGGEISKLCQLCRVEHDHAEVKKVKAQLKSAQETQEDNVEEEKKASMDADPKDTKEEPDKGDNEAIAGGDLAEMKTDQSNEPAQESAKEACVDGNISCGANFELTSRDVLHLQLSRLPPLCQSIINKKLGIDSSLMELTARNVANQLRASGQTLEGIRDALPSELVDLITVSMSKVGL